MTLCYQDEFDEWLTLFSRSLAAREELAGWLSFWSFMQFWGKWGGDREKDSLETRFWSTSASLHSCQKPAEQEVRWSEGKLLLCHFTVSPTIWTEGSHSLWCLSPSRVKPQPCPVAGIAIISVLLWNPGWDLSVPYMHNLLSALLQQQEFLFPFLWCVQNWSALD